MTSEAQRAVPRMATPPARSVHPETEAAEAPRAAGPANRRVLLLGSSGRLGGAIAGALAARERIELVAPSRRELGAAGVTGLDEAVANWFAKWQPDVVVNCIAMSDVDRCELEPGAAWRVNAELPAALGRAAATRTRLIHFSTDFVFDGAPGKWRRPYRETDSARPLSVYGASKLAGERAVAEFACRHWIFRVSWLYGAPAGNLAARLLDLSSAGQTIRLASNRTGVPNPVGLLADEIAACLSTAPESFATDSFAPERAPPEPAAPEHAHGERAAPERAASERAAREPPAGVYHLSCQGFTTWHEFGMAFVKEAIAAGRIAADRAPRIEPFDEATLSRPAKRPSWSPLDPALYARSFGRTLPHWREAIGAAQESMLRTRADFEHYLGRVPDALPQPGDERVD